MKKEEILKANKKDNKLRDEYEINMDIKGYRLGGLIALFLTTFYYCYEILTTFYYCYEIISGRGSNSALYSIITIFCGVTFLYKGIKVERHRKTNIFAGVIWLIVTILLIISYFEK